MRKKASEAMRIAEMTGQYSSSTKGDGNEVNSKLW